MYLIFSSLSHAHNVLSLLAHSPYQVTIYDSKKKLKLLTTLEDASSTVTGVKFSKDTQTLAVSSMDRSLRFYGQ